jgi:predicted Zn-dependent protease
MGNKWLLILFGILLWSAPIFGQVSPNNIVPHTGLVQKSTHLAPKDDLQAIGSRSIGAKGWKNWYSLEDEISMGHEYSEDVEASSKLLTDSVITEYVNRIGQKIVRNSDAKVPFKIKIIDSDEVNAFALPGGFLYVNSALIMEAQEEAELAGVMAHEIAHVAAHHATRQMTRSQLLTLASIPLVFVGGGVGLAVREGAALVTPLTLTRFSRGFEREADYLGVEYLYQAGYDPQAFISFFERIQKLEKEKPSAISKMFSNHPQTADRIHRTQAEIAKILPPREAYVVSTSEFDVVKARLAMLERRSISREKGTVRPSLRRRSSDNPRNSEEDGERPTLKR